MAIWKVLEKDPFRIFFPLGALLALGGVSPWMAQLYAHGSYPRDLHRVLMIDGFLLSFVAGFLMTAITRFTGTHFATRREITGVFGAIVGVAVGAFFPAQAASFFFAALVLAQVALFAVRRFRKRTSNPPYTFVFIGLGLLLWFASNAILCAIAAGLPVSDSAAAVARDVFSNGAIMSLVLGVGGRLLPGILGWDEIVVAQRARYEVPDSFHKVIPFGVWLSIALFLASFLMLPFVEQRWCFLLRGLVTLYFGIAYWRIHHFPKTKSYLTWSLWTSAWCLVLGYFLPAFWGAAAVHGLHLIFVGGFSLITLLISMRVTFAHGKAGTGVESMSWVIALCAGLVVIASVTRASAILWPSIYLDHLAYAAICWLLGLFAWGWAVFRTGRMLPIPN